jgi:uncharacterized membrane protein YgcG
MLYIPYDGPQKLTPSAWLLAREIRKLGLIEFAIAVAVLGAATSTTPALAISIQEPLHTELIVSTDMQPATDPELQRNRRLRCRRPIVRPRDCISQRRWWPCCAPGGSASSAAAGGSPTQGEVASSRSSSAAGAAAGSGGGGGGGEDGGGSGAASPGGLSFGSFTDPIVASSPINPVPGPVAGSGVPAFIFGFLMIWWWRRRTAHV